MFRYFGFMQKYNNFKKIVNMHNQEINTTTKYHEPTDNDFPKYGKFYENIVKTTGSFYDNNQLILANFVY